MDFFSEVVVIVVVNLGTCWVLFRTIQLFENTHNVYINYTTSPISDSHQNSPNYVKILTSLQYGNYLIHHHHKMFNIV